MGRERRAETLLTVGVSFGYALLAIAPLVLLLGMAFLRSGSPGSDLLELGAPGLQLFLGSCGLALATTLCALAIGLPFGLLLSCFDLPGRRVWFALHALPLLLPPFLLALGGSYLLDPRAALWLSGPRRLFFGPTGAVLLLAFALAPVVTALVALALSQTSARALEAARLFARPARVALHVLLPHALPSAALAAIVVFSLAFSELGVPMFLGVRVYPAAVFTRLGGLAYGPGEAAALAIPMLGVGLALLAAERRVRRFEAPGAIRWQRDRTPIPLGGMFWPMSALAALLTGASVLPLIGLASVARGATPEDLAPAWPALANGLAVAGLAAGVIAGLALAAGWVIGRRRSGAALLDSLLVFGFVAPAAVLGVGLIGIWNRPALSAIYETSAILVVGYVARYAVIGARTVAASIGQTSPTGEEAAALAGAGFFRRMLHIVAGEHARALLGAWFLCFAFCLRDLETSILYYPPGSEPLTVRIFTLEANGPEAQVAAFALLQVCVTSAVLLAACWVLRPRGAAQS